MVSTDNSSDSKSVMDEGKFTKHNHVDQACAPLCDLIAADDQQIFVIDSIAGLSGNQMVRQYPCLLDKKTGAFFVLLGDAAFSLFSKSTFMNLCTFAEDHGAKTIVLILDRFHEQKREYRRMFKVIDAVRMKKAEATSHLKLHRQLAGVNELAFFKMSL